MKSNGRKMNKPYFDFFNYSGLQRQPKEAAFLLKRRWEALPADYKA